MKKIYINCAPHLFRSKVRVSKPTKKEFNIEDLFGTVAFSSTSKESKYPNTVPFAKDTLRSSILGDIFDNTDHKHSSATVVFNRRKATQNPSTQQVFLSTTNTNSNNNNNNSINNNNNNHHYKLVL